jgi:hypothetical protein
LSREHIVSESILGPGPVTVSGFDWTESKSIQISASAHTAKILCRKHNSDLSPLDTEIKRIRDSFKSFYSFASSGFKIGHLGPPVSHIINGKLFERWLLKTTINHLVHSPKKYRNYQPAPYLVDLVFGKKEFNCENKWGLYLVDPSVLNNITAKPSTVAVLPNLIEGTDPDTNSKELVLIGSFIVIFGVPLYLKVATTQNLSAIWNGVDLLNPKHYHPGGIVLLKEETIDRTLEIKFTY